MPAALFDLDETILDRTGSLIDFANWQADEILGSSDDVRNVFVARFVELDKSGKVWKDKVYESLIKEFDLSSYTVDDLLDTYVNEFCKFCKPRIGALEAVHAFHRKGYKLGLVTNGKTPFQERNFHALGVSELFNCIIVSEAVNLRKPEKAIFELASVEVNVPVHQCVFIGDNPVADMEGAKNADMSTIYTPIDFLNTVSDTDTDTEEQAGKRFCEFADETFSDLTRLVEYINTDL